MNKNRWIYLKALLALVEVKSIRARKFRVLTDPVNGVVCELSVQMLEQLGCEVVKHNCEMDRLPQRAPEPRVKSLEETAKQVLKNQADLGLGFDMDADRVLFIDETGEVLSEDLVGVILGKNEIKQKGDVLVTPYNSSGLFKRVIEGVGSRVVECRVGPPEIIKTIKKEKAVFGYEESGKYFFSRHFIWADGLLASIKMLDILAKTDLSLSQIRQQYPKYYQVKLGVKCAWEKMPKRWIGKGEKQVFGKSFLFIRASGTEPLIRIFSDSPSQKKAEELAIRGKEIVEQVCAG